MTWKLSKRGLALAVSALLVMLAGTAFASVHGLFKGNPIVKLVVDGREVKADVPAFVMDGRTLIPARFLAEALGATVLWDPGTYTVNVTSKKTSVPAGTREGFYMTDKNVGIMVVSPTLKKDAYGHVAGMGNKFLKVLVVAKNFSDVDQWISPETFSITIGNTKYDHVSVTFSDTARLIPRVIKPGEMGMGTIIFEVPENATYYLEPGQMLYSLEKMKVPVIPVE